ncbi:MAG: methylmalonyl-CoA epimerase [Chloroflexi bacterium]|nr:methylmalonyl-CoA epimerase [Chloroflexota bacterium]
MKPLVKKIDHIALVVDNIDEALGFWHEALGLNLSHVEDVPREKSVVAFLPAQESEVELVKPTSEDSGIARFLKKRGPGMHHICFEVYDIEETMSHLRTKGVRLINQEPEIGTGGKKIAFIHPESTNGVLVELYELTSNEMEIRLERARALADRVVANSQQVAASAREFLRNLRNGEGKN